MYNMCNHNSPNWSLHFLENRIHKYVDLVRYIAEDNKWTDEEDFDISA